MSISLNLLSRGESDKKINTKNLLRDNILGT
jgi:hypothetical protein